jgi:hypothetical protein
MVFRLPILSLLVFAALVINAFMLGNPEQDHGAGAEVETLERPERSAEGGPAGDL